MIKIFLFGAGKSSEIVENNLVSSNVEILGYLDNDISKQGSDYKQKKIISPKDVRTVDYDYIIIGSVHYEAIINQLIHMGIDKAKVIAFFSKEYYESDKYADLIIKQSWKNEAYKKENDVRYELLEKKFNTFINNMKYEAAEMIQKGKLKFPVIESSDKLLKLLVDEHYSLSRYGDGEFEIMRGQPRHNFQNENPDLGKRMKEILTGNLEKHVVGIAPYYGDLSQYDDEAQNAIRLYMTEEVRQFHYSILDMEKVYYDACISRPYVLHRDKKGSKNRFLQLQKIWEDRKLLIVEGIQTRMGVGNDLFSNAKAIRRILGPAKNAYGCYEQLLDEILRQAAEDELILIALGATATVLAYDLAREGYQAIDIGHVDLEYEWYLKGMGKRFNIACKYVNECDGGDEVEDITSDWYWSQVIGKIGCEN